MAGFGATNDGPLGAIALVSAQPRRDRAATIWVGYVAGLGFITKTKHAELDGAYAWLRVAISVLIALISTVGMWSVVVILPGVQRDFGIDRAEASMPYTAVMVGFAFGNFLLGRLVDRYSITKVLIGAALVLGTGFALTSIAANIWQFTIIQGVLIGVGTSAGFGPLIADISHWFRRRRGIAVSMVAGGNYLAGAVWPLLLKDIIAEDGWRAAHYLIAIVIVGAVIPLSLLLRRQPPLESAPMLDSPSRRRTSGRTVDLSPRVLQGLLIIAGLSCCVAMSMPQVHLVAYCGDLGYGPAAGAEMLSLMLAGGVVSRLAWGFLSDYIGGLRALLFGSVLQGIALLLYIPFDGLASLYVVSLVFGLAQGGIVPAYAMIVRENLPASEAGQRIGVVLMSTVIGMAFGGWLSGWIFDQTGSYQAAFLNGIAWNLFNVTIMASLLWRTRLPKPANG